ncbi:uncharacterized protein LOC134192832 [Corticium candelabrum]|uniref:uncharacterized protein LOC134192832 n=1 Tax=Corticium candelabrum TaxID=121492 RepID=UPI002E26F277|nr:uncharacterized protein LOC134192832 [Corticium candelabrum]
MFWCAVLVFAGTATVSQSARNFTLVTFNTGLTPSNLVPFYQERRDALKTHLATSSISADVLCLQELFRDKDITDLVDATRHQFPYHYRASSGDRQNPSNPPCSQSALGAAFGGCLTVNCSTALARGFLSFLACAFTTCYSDVSSFGQECVNCITNQNPQSSSSIRILCFSLILLTNNNLVLQT